MKFRVRALVEVALDVDGDDPLDIITRVLADPAVVRVTSVKRVITEEINDKAGAKTT